MKQFLSILIFLSFLVCSTNAQETQRPESYNYKQGVEALQNNDLEKALEFLNKELQEHKDNGYAFVWLAVIRNYLEEYGKALTAANSSIRYIPKEDSVFRYFISIFFAYDNRSSGGSISLQSSREITHLVKSMLS